MKKLLSLLPASAILAAALLSACNSSDSGDGSADTFSVKFALASIPENLTLDSLQIKFTLGDTGSPQDFTLDLATGTSKAKVMAYPGQNYSLSFILYAAGYDIGMGEKTGTLAKDMNIVLGVKWDMGKVGKAKEKRETGSLLPAHLESALGLALAGRPIGFRLDSAAGYDYAWYVRQGDSTVASGTGTRLDYTPGDSLGGATLNIKLVVKKDGVVVEERDWDVKVLDSMPKGRLAGIVTKSDTAAAYGTYTRFKYNVDGKYDSILYYDTTVFVSGRDPVAGLSFTYTKAHHPTGDPTMVIRWARNESDIDSSFSYDSKGRLTAVTVTLKSGTTVDSLAYPSDKSTVIRSFAQGKLMRELRHHATSETAEVDSIYSQGDSGLVLTGLVEYVLEGGRVATKRYFRKFEELTAFAGEWNLYNLLGLIAYRKRFEEGATLVLGRTESYSYRNDGLLDQVIIRDEVTGEIEKAEYRKYESAPAAKPGAASSAQVPASALQIENRDRLLGLSEVGRLFPLRLAPSTR